jgi:hypothetical protein
LLIAILILSIIRDLFLGPHIWKYFTKFKGAMEAVESLPEYFPSNKEDLHHAMELLGEKLSAGVADAISFSSEAIEALPDFIYHGMKVMHQGTQAPDYRLYTTVFPIFNVCLNF